MPFFTGKKTFYILVSSRTLLALPSREKLRLSHFRPTPNLLDAFPGERLARPHAPKPDDLLVVRSEPLYVDPTPGKGAGRRSLAAARR